MRFVGEPESWEFDVTSFYQMLIGERYGAFDVVSFGCEKSLDI